MYIKITFIILFAIIGICVLIVCIRTKVWEVYRSGGLSDAIDVYGRELDSVSLKLLFIALIAFVVTIIISLTGT